MTDSALTIDEIYVRGMERLVTVAQELSLARSMSEIQNIVKVTARHLTRADGATFVLRDGDQCHYVDEDAIAPLWKGFRFPLTYCISGWAMLNAQPAVIEDIYTDVRIPVEVYRPTFIKSLAMVPIRTAAPIGAIGAYWGNQHAPTEAEVKLLQALADTTSVAMENVRLYQELEERVSERTLALESAQRTEKALLRVQDQLRQSQKMEAVGLLAAGVAHDFNNVLTVILSYGSMVFNALPTEDPLREDVSEIVAAGERAAALTKQLLAFSKQQVLEPRILNISQVLEASESLLQRLLTHEIQFDVKNDPDLYTVFADPSQIEQVLLNLVVNARDAMPSGGKIAITTQNRKLKKHEVTGLPAGDYVKITVTDTGTGMSDEIKERIFEPFFTTKEMGTGLGLSTVYGIVRQSGGHILVNSTVGKGSEFKVYFPRQDGVVASSDYIQGRVVGGTETLLIVEVESRVRQVTARVLIRAGYTVLEAPSAIEALSIYERHKQAGNTVSLILTDCALPGQSGLALARQVHAQCPNLRVIWMSGTPPVGLVEAGFPFLAKPLTPTSLLNKVRQVLDSLDYGVSVGSKQ
jgi:two-component system, cell cycle sensor histidine kinase and response regulator CckA